MFESDEPVAVSLLCDNEVMKGVLDQFGMDVKVRRVDKDHFSINVMVCASPTFYAWVFQWEGRVKIEAPATVAERMQEMARGFVK